jgi:hypothetical protein
MTFAKFASLSATFLSGAIALGCITIEAEGIPVPDDLADTGLVDVSGERSQVEADAAAAIETAVNEAAVEPEPEVTPKPCIVGVDVLAAAQPAAELTGGYKLLGMSLNVGVAAESSGLWLYYKLGPDDGSDGQCLTGLYTVNTSRGETDPEGGTRINVDLNQNAGGGDTLYLGYVRQPGAEPLRAIALRDTDATVYSDGGAASSYLWVAPAGSSVPQDLNEGAGGDFVFMGTSCDRPE